MKNEQTIRESAIELVQNIKTGVKDEFGVRNYDALDAISDIKNIETVVEYVKRNMSAQDNGYVSKFINKYGDFREVTEEKEHRLVESSIEIGCRRDMEGMLIPGTGIVINEANQMELIRQMKARNIPVTVGTYNSVLERYKRKCLHTGKPTARHTERDGRKATSIPVRAKEKTYTRWTKVAR